jgi:hypothetical protein
MKTQNGIEAMISYSVDTGEKPVAASHQAGGPMQQEEGRLVPRAMTILNGRDQQGEFELEHHGFVFGTHGSEVRDFWDAEELTRVYYPEMERLIAEESGASRVHIFDHTLRSSDEEVQKARSIRETVKTVHNDYTDWSGPQRVRDLFEADEANDLLGRRFAVIQTWRPIGAPVVSAPLAICDASSMSPEDFIAAERRHPDRIGEIYHISHSAGHRWYYFPSMTRDEILIFKCYDSATDGRSRFTAHGSFDDPTASANAPPRESIEIRSLVFFDDLK